ncbi:MAG: MFS transporter [candidate division NC10 bacterium]|nr:MFS transporter [candidate division NC10 bacterium]
MLQPGGSAKRLTLRLLGIHASPDSLATVLSNHQTRDPLNSRARDLSNPRPDLSVTREACLTSTRILAAYYFWYFAAVGVLEPFLAPWWRQVGFTSAEIGALNAIMPGVACVAPFLWTAYADATRQGDRIFRLNSWLCALTALLLPLLTWMPAVAAAMVVFAAVRAPLIPLANAMAFQALGGHRQGYARIRLWGTAGYILTAVLAGSLVDRTGLRLALAGAGLTLAVCGLLAWCGRSEERLTLPPVSLHDVLESLKNRQLLLVVVAAGLAWLSYGPYATFYTIHLDRLGFSRSFAGLAWAAAASSELAVMLLWPRLAPWLSPQNRLLIGLAASPVRWLLAAMATEAPLLLATQGIHALSFGAFYLAAVERVDALAQPGLRATAQGVFAAVTFGLGGLLGNLAGGLTYERLGMRRIYLLMAGISALATALYWAGTGFCAGHAKTKIDRTDRKHRE